MLEAIPERTARKPMYHAGELMGLPRFPESRFICSYPFYDVELIDVELPFEVRMRAYTPFIPLDEESSGMPFYKVVYQVKKLFGQSGGCLCRGEHIKLRRILFL